MVCSLLSLSLSLARDRAYIVSCFFAFVSMNSREIFLICFCCWTFFFASWMTRRRNGCRNRYEQIIIIIKCERIQKWINASRLTSSECELVDIRSNSIGHIETTISGCTRLFVGETERKTTAMMMKKKSWRANSKKKTTATIARPNRRTQIRISQLDWREREFIESTVKSVWCACVRVCKCVCLSIINIELETWWTAS